MRRLVAALALTLGTGLLFGAHAKEAGITDKEIVIGGIMPFTGPPGMLGYATTIGNRMAAQEINDAGGINGRKIRIVVEDDRYVPAQTVQALQKLLDSENIFALASCSGGAHALAMMPTIEELGLPVINPAVTTSAHYEPPRKSFFGVGMVYDEGAMRLVRAMNKLHPSAKWAAIVQDDESGIDREKGFDQVMKELGMKPVLKQRFKRGQTDFASEMLRLKESGATAVLLGGLPAQNATMVREAKKLGIQARMGVLWVDHIPPMIDLVGEAGDGLYVYDFVPSITDENNAFMKLAKKYVSAEEMPKVNRYSMLGYVAVKLYGEAIKACGKDVTRACVASNLEKITNYKTGFMAPISFGPGVRLAAPEGNLLKIDAAGKRFVPVAVK